MMIPERKFIIEQDFDTYLQKPVPPKLSSKKPCWIAKHINLLHLKISKGVCYDYMLANIRLFQPKIVMDIDIDNFLDEDNEAEKFMELLGYYEMFTDNLKELVLKHPLKKTPPAQRIDVLRKVIQEGRKFRKDLRLLSVSGYTTDPSVDAVLRCNVFPNLEVFKVKFDQVKMNYYKIKKRIKLANLRKLDMTGCCIKFDNPYESQNGVHQLQQMYMQHLGNHRVLTQQELIKIKKEALAKNYKKFLKKRGAEYEGEGEEDEKNNQIVLVAKKFQGKGIMMSSQTSNESDDLEEVRESHIGIQKFDMESDFFC
ncbi:UNKNOWN [Stylonychia lemnae]|uniref:Uncharacterized protein n=1 Tax=Stylonychia lemnae TaxID=5949 RepID=A0A078AJ47_STYLE|nr:UNKNOWN [Stylonychia lemnae]|eukprot:CDW81916.1 UNKNOWN [Stylonychia lemnae]